MYTLLNHQLCSVSADMKKFKNISEKVFFCSLLWGKNKDIAKIKKSMVIAKILVKFKDSH